MSLARFQHSRKGKKIGAILTAPASIRAMVQTSERNRPAVEAVASRIVQEVGSLDDEEKKLVGRWVRQVLAPRGWIPDRKGRVAAGNLFVRGTIYRRAASSNPFERPRTAAERVAAARAILATMPYPIMTSEELIAERRRAFEAGE